MIKIRFGESDRYLLEFKDHDDAVRFLRSQALPWKDCGKKSSCIKYKQEVARRAAIKYGDHGVVRTLSSKEFIHDLFRLGEIAELSEIENELV